jgi:molybdate transport repressor ModE-like protein
MFSVSINPQWTITGPAGGDLGPRVVELLVLVDSQGSLSAACTAGGISYRHAWQLLREGEALFGQPLLVMLRGKGSHLTPLGERLVGAHRRVQARLSPMLETLASELGAELEKVLSAQPGLLRMHASHGFAVQSLHEILTREGLPHELKYCASAEALESLSSGHCDIAGFHVPIGEFQAAAIEHWRPWLDAKSQRLIQLVTRRQGLMTRAGNPKKVYEIADLARPDVRFINRQPGSGTRFLLDELLKSRGIAPASIRGYERCEFTHAAVAAFVASDMADVAMGVEVPAREFKLEFIPLLQERYFLVCRVDQIDAPAVRQVLQVLASDEFKQSIDNLPGYAADDTGAMYTLAAAFPGFVPAAA